MKTTTYAAPKLSMKSTAHSKHTWHPRKRKFPNMSLAKDTQIHCCGYLLTPFLSVCTGRRWQEHYQYCREQKGQQLLHSDAFALREQLMTVKEIQSIQLFSLQSRSLSSSRRTSGSPTGWSSGSQCPGLGEHIHFPQHTVGYRQVEEITPMQSRVGMAMVKPSLWQGRRWQP